MMASIKTKESDRTVPASGQSYNDECHLHTNKSIPGDTGDKDAVTSQGDVPDGGWGWMVVVGAGINSLMVGLILHASGIIYLQFRNRYNSSAIETVWASAINQLLQGFLGPLAAWLVHHYSSRLAAQIGTVFIVVGMIGTAFAPNIYVVYFTYGVLPGIGFSLTQTASFLLVGAYFERRKARALALTSFNQGIGALVFGPVVVLLEQEYLYQGMFLILAAIFAHIFVSAALFRPLRLRQFTPSSGLSSSTSEVLHSSKSSVSSSCRCRLSLRKPVLRKPVGQNVSTLQVMPLTAKRQDSSVQPLSTDKDRGPLIEGFNAYTLQNKPMESSPTTSPKERNAQDFSDNSQASPIQSSSTRQTSSQQEPHTEKQDKHNQGFLHMFRAAGSWRLAAFAVAVFSSFAATSTATSFTPALAVEIGLPMTLAASLISVLGISFVIGTLFIGSLLDIPALRRLRLNIYSVCFFLTGAGVMTLPLGGDFTTLVIPTVLGSVSAAVLYTQLITVLTDLVGRQHVAAAFGLVRIAAAFGALIGRTVSGAIVDAVGSNSLPFYVFGAMPIASSMLFFGFLARLQCRRRIVLTAEDPPSRDMSV